jgi:hypothetical protein
MDLRVLPRRIMASLPPEDPFDRSQGLSRGAFGWRVAGYGRGMDGASRHE